MERNCSGRRSEVRRRRRLSRSVVVVDPFPFRECVCVRERERERESLFGVKTWERTGVQTSR